MNYSSINPRWSDQHAINSFYDCIVSIFSYSDEYVAKIWSESIGVELSKNRVRSHRRPEKDSNFRKLTKKQLCQFLNAVCIDLGIAPEEGDLPSIINQIKSYVDPSCTNTKVEETLLHLRMIKRGF